MKTEANQSSAARLAIKAMGLFGSVQVLNIACSLVRNKLVALWLGPAGAGLFGVLNNALEMLHTGSNLGMRQSSVRDIARSHAGGDECEAGITSAVVRRWSVWLGVGGAMLTLCLSPLLSIVTFRTTANWWMFAGLAVALLLMSLTNGRQAVLQGTAQLNRLARVGVVGSLAGLAVSVPLFYIMGMSSVLPSVIAYAAAAALSSWWWRDRTLPDVRVAARDAWFRGRSFIVLGAYMTLGSFATGVSGFALTAWLTSVAGLGVVGIYQSGFTLVNKYTGLVLSALGLEFYPRLASRAGSRLHTRVQMSQQLNVAVTVTVPVVLVLILLRQPVVRLLYVSTFVGACDFVLYAGVGMVARAVSWCIAFVMLARGDGRIYLVTEVASAVLSLALGVVGYRLGGVAGMGVAHTLWYVSYAVVVWAVYRFRYRLTLSHAAWATAIIGSMLPVLLLVLPSSLAWLMTTVVTLAAVCRLWCLWGLRSTKKQRNIV